MPRLKPLATRDDVPESARPIFDEIASSRGDGVSGPTTFMMYSPEAALHSARMVNYLRDHSTLKPAEAELAILTSARSTNSAYIWAAHVRNGLAKGVRPEAIAVIDARGPLDSLTTDERLIVQFGRELMLGDEVTDETFNAVHQRWGEQGLIELLSLMARYVLTAYVLKAVDLRPAPDAAKLSM